LEIHLQSKLFPNPELDKLLSDLHILNVFILLNDCEIFPEASKEGKGDKNKTGLMLKEGNVLKINKKLGIVVLDFLFCNRC